MRSARRVARVVRHGEATSHIPDPMNPEQRLEFVLDLFNGKFDDLRVPGRLDTLAYEIERFLRIPQGHAIPPGVERSATTLQRGYIDPIRTRLTTLLEKGEYEVDLQKIRLRVSYSTGQNVSWTAVAYPSALIDWQLAAALQDGPMHRLRRCERVLCGKLYLGRPKQRFCDLKGSNAEQQARYRARQKRGSKVKSG